MERDSQPDPLPGDDDIEILEVVGLDEPDSSAASRRSGGPSTSGAGTDRGGEILFDLEPQPERKHGSDSPTAGTERISREQWLRLSSDFENFRRRTDREREANERHASASLVTRLLPVLDNFERALSGDPRQGSQRFYDGVALIFRQILDELHTEGLVAVDSVGEPFDPAVHEAVSTTVEPALPPNIVVEELQRGYRMHDRLLRPALVKVTVDPADAARESRRGPKGR